MIPHCTEKRFVWILKLPQRIGPLDENSILLPSGKCHQIFSILLLMVAVEHRCYSLATQRGIAHITFADSYPSWAHTHPPQNENWMSTREKEWVTRPNMHHGYVTLCGADNGLQRLIHKHASSNLTPQAILVRVDCGHWGCLITGGSRQLSEKMAGCGFWKWLLLSKQCS